MKIAPFRLERYFAQYEFNTPYLLCSSDCESLSVRDLLAMEPDGVEAFQSLWLGYTESRGHPLLREEIAGLYAGMQPEGVLVHSGAEEAIFLFLNALLEPGDHVVVHWPCYQSLYEVAHTIGCEISLWAGDASSGWRLDVDQLEGMLRANTRAVLVNCPHNPTGGSMDAQSWEQLNRLSEQHGFIVFSDEVYRGLEYDESSILPAWCEINERGVSLGVLSKSYGLAGLRIGWVATHNQEIVERMASMKDYTTICTSAPSEMLGAIAIRHGERLIARNRVLIARNLRILDAFFQRNAARFDWLRPMAGPIAFPRLQSGDSAQQFCRALVEQAGVLLLPGDLYAPEYSAHFRIGFGRANMPEAVARLDQFLQEYPAA